MNPVSSKHPCKFCFKKEVYSPLCEQCRFYLLMGWISLRGNSYIKRGQHPGDAYAKKAWKKRVQERAEKDRLKYTTKKIRLASL